MKLKETLMRDNLVSDALNEILYNPHLAKASTSIIQDDNIYFFIVGTDDIEARLSKIEHMLNLNIDKNAGEIVTNRVSVQNSTYTYGVEVKIAKLKDVSHDYKALPMSFKDAVITKI